MNADSGKKAILTVSFGTSHMDTLEKTIGAIERDFRKSFPEWEVRRAFTSRFILRKLRERGENIDTVGQALERLAAEGFETVICQPTHIIRGEEYDRMLEFAEPYRKYFRQLVFGAPLLDRPEDYRKAAMAIWKELPPCNTEEALVLMGHGTAHFSNSAYGAMAYLLQETESGNVFLGTVEGFPDLESVLRRVNAYRPKRVRIVPFMVVAGDHAVNDMAGDGSGSWLSVFSAAGYETEAVVRGLGELEQFRSLYCLHVRCAMEELIQRK